MKILFRLVLFVPGLALAGMAWRSRTVEAVTRTHCARESRVRLAAAAALSEAAHRHEVSATVRGEAARARRELDAELATHDQLLEQLNSPPPNAGSDADVHVSPGTRIAVAACRNAGRCNPDRALETILWASAGGDVEALQESIEFGDAEAKAAAQRLLAGLPATERARYGSPEKLLAGLTVPDVPAGTIEVAGWTDISTDGSAKMVTLAYETAAGEPAQHFLMLRRSASGWKAVVTGAAVARYSARLLGPRTN
jgi:hypothetical protein